MASIDYDTKCPNCHLIATVDDYFKIGTQYVNCSRCGYSHRKYYKWNGEKEDYDVVIDKQEGHGVYVLKGKDGGFSIHTFNTKISDEDIECFKERYFSDETNQENSYLVRFEGGEFKVILGTLPEYFFLPFEKYRDALIL